MMKILVINGPNLNLLSQREPSIYGHDDLCSIEKRLVEKYNKLMHLSFFQSQSESDIVTKIHSTIQSGDQGIIINAAAFTHTSIAIRDALLGVNIPFIEVHLSNVHKREPFRHHSYLSDCAVGVICGFKSFSYDLAAEAMHHYLNNQ